MDGHSKVIRKLPVFVNKVIKISPLHGGITNASFKITAGSKNYVARFGFALNKHLGTNRRQEFFNSRIAASLGIGPKIVALVPKYDLLLAEYIEGQPLTEKSVRYKGSIKKIAEILRKLHRGKNFKGRFDIYKICQKYLTRELSTGSQFKPEATTLLKDLLSIKSKLGNLPHDAQCHLDLAYTNIISSKDGLKIIDWEYSANSYHMLDLAILSAVSDFNYFHDKYLLRAYGEKVLDREKFKMLKALALIREIGWDMLQVRYSKINFNYKKFTRDNLRKYRLISKGLFS